MATSWGRLKHQGAATSPVPAFAILPRRVSGSHTIGGGMPPPAPGGMIGNGAAPADPMQQAIAQAVSQLLPQLVQACGVSNGQQTNVGQACWAQIWGAVGCTMNAPPFEQWHQSQNLEVCNVLGSFF